MTLEGQEALKTFVQAWMAINHADAVTDKIGQVPIALDQNQSSMYVLIYVIASYNRNISSLSL